MRKIIHIDMDAFYASVEQRDNPALKGKPIVVGGSPQSRGVVASASYEARKYGIRSAMSCAQAYRLHPATIFVTPHFEKYLAASRKIREIFKTYTPLVEPLALDEAYLDVTSNLTQEPLAGKIALEIKKRIFSELQITASAGVGPNKFIAKLASDFKKPDGLTVIPPERVSEFIQKLPVQSFWGVGPATAKRLNHAGIYTAEDIRSKSVASLEKVVGSYASFLFDLAHGKDDREVDPSFEPKSRGTETTFAQDLTDTGRLLQVLEEQAEEVAFDLQKIKRPGRTVTLKLKYADFTSITRSQTLFHPTDEAQLIYSTASDLLFRDTEIQARAVRLIGISMSNLVHEDDPLQLWFHFSNTKKL